MQHPLQLVVMGVSGCGKSTVSKAISERLGLEMADGDDFHSPGSVAKMQAGVALDDDDRWPWLDRIGAHLAKAASTQQQQRGTVVACSALKYAYRNRIRNAAPNVIFIFLDGDKQLIHHRMSMRQGHFMHLDLLESQLKTLEKPTARESDVITMKIEHPVHHMLNQIIAALQERQQLDRVISA